MGDICAECRGIKRNDDNLFCEQCDRRRDRRHETYDANRRKDEDNKQTILKTILDIELDSLENNNIAKRKLSIVLKSPLFLRNEEKVFNELRHNIFFTDAYYKTCLGLKPNFDSIKKLRHFAYTYITEWAQASEDSAYARKILNIILADEAEKKKVKEYEAKQRALEENKQRELEEAKQKELEAKQKELEETKKRELDRVKELKEIERKRPIKLSEAFLGFSFIYWFLYIILHIILFIIWYTSEKSEGLVFVKKFGAASAFFLLFGFIVYIPYLLIIGILTHIVNKLKKMGY